MVTSLLCSTSEGLVPLGGSCRFHKHLLGHHFRALAVLGAVRAALHLLPCFLTPPSLTRLPPPYSLFSLYVFICLMTSLSLLLSSCFQGLPSSCLRILPPRLVMYALFLPYSACLSLLPRLVFLPPLQHLPACLSSPSAPFFQALVCSLLVLFLTHPGLQCSQMSSSPLCSPFPPTFPSTSISKVCYAPS